MKKIIIILATLTLLIVTQPASAMQPVAARTAGQLLKHFGKKAFAGTMTGLHWIIAGGLPIGFGMTQAYTILNEENVCKQLPDANEQTTDFFISELQKTGTQINSVKINPVFDALQMPIATMKKNIAISRSTEDKISKALQNNDETTKRMWGGVSQHEASHIRHNDMALRCATALSLPFVTHKTTKTIQSILPYTKKAKPFLLQQCIKIPTGFLKLALSVGTFAAVCRHQEQRADNEVANDINTLKGLKNVFCEYELEAEKEKHKLLSPNQIKISNAIDPFFALHPSVAQRVKKLDERITSLEKQSKNEEIRS